MIRYSAWHKSDPGYRSPEAAQKWIDLQENPGDWIIVATTDDFEPSAAIDQLHDYLVEKLAVEKEQRRIATLLGLSQVLK